MALPGAANTPETPGGDPSAGGPPGGGGGPPGLNGGQPGGVFGALSRSMQVPGPTAPGAGDQGDGLMGVKMAIEMLAKALPSLNGTPAFVTVADALKRLGKHVPQGAPTAGVQQTFLRDLMRALSRNPIQQKLAQMQQGQGGDQEQPPMPATPLPGA